MKLLISIIHALQTVFGTFRYEPPRYLTSLFGKIKQRFTKQMVDSGTEGSDSETPAEPKTHRPIPRLIKILVPVLLIGISGLYWWYSSLPEPRKVRVTTSAPRPMKLIANTKPDPINVNFNGSAARLKDVQKELTSGVKIDPEIQGIWKWSKDNLLHFQPQSDWNPGTKYEIKLDQNLFPKHVLLDKYELEFTTAPFKLDIRSTEFHIDPVNEDLKQVTATVKFTHPVDPQSFEKRLSLQLDNLSIPDPAFSNREYDISVKYDDYMGIAYILSESLPMPDEDVTLKLVIKEGVKDKTGTKTSLPAESMVIIPGITNFIKIRSVAQTMVRNDDYKLEQILVINSQGKARNADLIKYVDAWILPKDRPATPGISAEKKARWRDAALIGPEVLALSEKIELQEMEAENAYSELNSFKVNVPPEKYLYARIKKGAPFYGKYNLSREYASIVRVERFPEEVKIMHDGILLSSNGKKKVSIMSMGLDQVRFKIGRIPPDQLNHLISQSNGDLTDLQFQSYLFDEENIVDNSYETRRLITGAPGEPNYFSFDFNKYLTSSTSGSSKKGVFFFEVTDWNDSRYSRGIKDRRLIMISDMGVLIKDATNQTHDVFVQSINSGIPVSGAKVEVIGKNGIPIMTEYTDSRGHAEFSSFNGFRNEQSPTVYVITKGNDLTFMPVQARGRWLNYSKFDVGGVHGQSNPSKLDAYLFSDRGIYRPGDTFNIGMIVKAGDWGRSISDTPLEVSIQDSRGLEVYKKMFRLSSSGFEEVSYKTEGTSPTGIYQIDLYTVRADSRYLHIGSTTVQIEEFLPDRLTINTFFPDVSKLAWVPPDKLAGAVSLRNLFGAPAVGNRLVASLQLSAGKLWFQKYRSYHFTDPLAAKKSYTEKLAEKLTDSQGKARFELDLSKYDRATYALSFKVNAFEKEGGRNVLSESSILVSPLTYLLGSKTNGDLSYIYRDSERKLSLIAIDPKLELVGVENLKFELMQIQQVSVLTKQPNGTYAYKSVPKTVPDTSFTRSIPATGLEFSLKTSEPGEYELYIKTPEGIQLLKTAYTVVGKGNLTRSLDKTSELEIKLNKSDYAPGEEIEIYIKAPYKGAGLITIERDQVYTYKWFKSTSNSFLEKIKLPYNLEGNAYINVAFVRAPDSKEIYMSPLSYGVAPFYISRENRMNPITLEAAHEARSGEAFEMTYSTEKPAKMVVFAVDEGILQVAGYTTPDPLAHFFKKRALELKTSQLLDLILPDIMLAELQGAMGGGMGFDEINNNLNPFKRKQQAPVVYWSGIVDADQTKRSLSYTVPDYFNGSLRVMAIAVSPSSIGRFQQTSVVRNPYVISPNVPMFAAPGDSFLVSLTVTNMLDGSGPAAKQILTVAASPQLKVANLQFKLHVPEDADTTLSFYVTANNLPGGASLKFTVEGGGDHSSLSSYLSVRPAVPYQTWIAGGIIKDDNTSVDLPRVLYEDFRTLEASVSYLPQGLSPGLVMYLDGFPHGCSEQVLSQAFPYLYLRETNGFGVEDKEASQKIDYALKVLQARQYSDGKIGIWAANSFTSDFITVYAAHFITECRQAGIYVSSTLYQNTLAALETIVKAKQRNLKELRIQAYAIYILTRNEQLTSNRISTVTKALRDQKANWQTDIAGAYIAGAYSIMKQAKEADAIFSDISVRPAAHDEPWYFCDQTIRDAQMLYLFARHAPQMLDQISDKSIERIAKVIADGMFTTVTSSYIIMGLDAFSSVSGEPHEGAVKLTQVLLDKSKQDLDLPQGQFPLVKFSPDARQLKLDNKDDKALYYQVVQAGFDTKLPTEQTVSGIEVYREFRNADGAEVRTVALGEEVYVHLKFRSVDQSNIYNVAIIDMLPAGLEAVPTSVRSNLGGDWTPEHTEIREDRLIFYGTVSKSVREISYQLRAINKGSFTVPPLYAECMYDRTIYCITPQDPIIVN